MSNLYLKFLKFLIELYKKVFIIHLNLNFKKKFTDIIQLTLVLLQRIFDTMNIYLFWILFLALWAIVPLMIIKGRVDEAPKIQTSPKVQAKKKGWFN